MSFISRQPLPPPINSSSTPSSPISPLTTSNYQSFTSGGNASIGFERMLMASKDNNSTPPGNNNNEYTSYQKSQHGGPFLHQSGTVTPSSSGETIRPAPSPRQPHKQTTNTTTSPISSSSNSSSSFILNQPTSLSAPIDLPTLSTFSGPSALERSSLIRRMGTGRGGSLKLKDSWRRGHPSAGGAVGIMGDEMGVAGEQVGRDGGSGGVGQESGIDGEGIGGNLHRHTSLPGRSAPSSFPTLRPSEPSTSTPLSRSGSTRSSSRHPSISEEGPPPISFNGSVGGKYEVDGSGAAGLGRSRSLKQVMEKDDWRMRSGGYGGDEQIPSVQIGHHRSHSHSSTSPNRAIYDLGSGGLSNSHLTNHQAHLYKSNSLRSTYSGPPGSNRRLGGMSGHSHTQSMYMLDSPPDSATSTLHPGSAWNDSLSSPISPTDAEAAHSHLGHGPFGHESQSQLGHGERGQGQDGDGMTAAAMLRRHQSLQQGYGKSHRVADRLARSQAILAIENRTPVAGDSGGSGGGKRSTTMEEPPTSPIGRSAWSNAAVGYDGNDGWEELSQLKQRQQAAQSSQSGQGQSPGGVYAGQGAGRNGQPGVNMNDMDPVRRLRLIQAMEAMQLGSEMMAPPRSASADVTHNPAPGVAVSQGGNFHEYGQNRAYGSAAIAQGTYGMNLGPVISLNGIGAFEPPQQNDFNGHQDYASPPLHTSIQDGQNMPGYPQMGYGGQPGFPQQGMPMHQAYNQGGNYYGQPNQYPSTSIPGGQGAHNLNYNQNFHGGLSTQSDPMQIQQMQRQMYTPSHIMSPQLTGPARPSSAGQNYPKSAPAGGGMASNQAVSIPPEIAEAAAREVREMIEKRGLNSPNLDCEVPDARYFVIKSFTEDDVQKSLKHEIWSSTNFGNQRLDKAFNEAKGPVYLFFSVNGSGHFCGMAQLLSGVNYNESSTVWAQDKWKGIMKLRWIMVKDIPNAALRHIRLLNMPEQKPITNSRDTQELLRDAGVEAMKIMSMYQEKTSLLHDYGYYEMQAAERAKQQTSGDPAIPTNPQSTTTTTPAPHTSPIPNNPNAPPIIVPTRSPATSSGGFVKTFNPTGPPSITNNKRFAVTSRGPPQGQGLGQGQQQPQPQPQHQTQPQQYQNQRFSVGNRT